MKGLLEFLAGPRPPCKTRGCGRRMLPLKRGVPVFVCRCGAMQVGKHTITLNASNLAVWSASGVPAALGDLGMDLATGRPQAFVGGVAAALAVLADIAGGGLTFVSAQNDSSGTFTSSSVAPTYTAVPSPTLGITQAALGTCLFAFQATDAFDASLRSGAAFAVRLDAGTFFPLTWATSSGAGNAIIFQQTGFRLFTGVAAGVHTLELGLALNGTVGPTVGVRRETAAPLRLLAIHT